jgi:hypothetical protein
MILSESEQTTIRELFNAPCVALCPQAFVRITDNATAALSEASEKPLDPTDPETVSGLRFMGLWMQLIRDTWDILQDEILKVRPLTSEELKSMDRLDAVLGQVLQRAARLVHGIQQFEQMENGGQMLC